jgi:hypothetical protein
MKIINAVYLSDYLSDMAYAHYSKKTLEELKTSLDSFKKYMSYKDAYEDMLYSQPNWTDNYSLVEMNVAKGLYREAEDLYLAAWDIPNAYMKAILCIPITMSPDTTRLIYYIVEIKGKRASLQVEIDAKGAWNYSLDTKYLDWREEGELDIYDYYQNKLSLTPAL